MRSVRGIVIALVALLLAPLALAQSVEELTNPAPEDWPTYGRTLDMQRYSPLDQVNTENVGELELVWTRDLDVRGRQQASPAVYDGVMYINGIDSEVIALDATTGELLWEYDATLDEAASEFTVRMRGSVVVYDGKVFYAQRDAAVVALDAETGEELWKTSVGNPAWSELFSAGPIFADGKLILGPAGADAGGNPGRVLALDTENGELLWTFNIIPGPEDEEAYATWSTPPDPEQAIGGGSAWTPGAYDPVTETVLYGTGQPNPWDNIDDRRGTEITRDLYTASTVALDVNTGELKWYHQTIPGDEWDYDQLTTPIVADVEINGETRRVVIKPTTSGYIEILDVETGELIVWHQMHPEPNVHLGYEEDGTPIIDDSMRRTEEGQTVEFPMRWMQYQPSAFNPDTGLFYIANTDDWRINTMYSLPDDWERGDSATNFDQTRVTDRFDRYGAVSAVEPATGEVVWEFTHGYEVYGSGVTTTAGDLVFAGFPDRTFRAFDAEDGEVLWERVLHAATESEPVTYAVDGRQYVALIAGTSRSFAHRPGLPDSVTGSSIVWVFALPE